jgi:hypothetical protein
MDEKNITKVMKKLILISLLFLSTTGFSQYKTDIHENKGLIMTIGGLGFTTAAILEGNYNYTTNKTVSNGNNTVITKQYTPPFFQQYPRSIMFTVGVSLTVTGLITLIAK